MTSCHKGQSLMCALVADTHTGGEQRVAEAADDARHEERKRVAVRNGADQQPQRPQRGRAQRLAPGRPRLHLRLCGLRCAALYHWCRLEEVA